MAEQAGVTNDIDFLAGTLGKALASVGGYLICSPTVKRYLVNKMRPFIFTTALPPVNILWTRFILGKLQSMNGRQASFGRHMRQTPRCDARCRARVPLYQPHHSDDYRRKQRCRNKGRQAVRGRILRSACSAADGTSGDCTTAIIHHRIGYGH